MCFDDIRRKRMAVLHSYVEFSMAMLDCQMVLKVKNKGKGCFDRRTDRNPAFLEPWVLGHDYNPPLDLFFGLTLTENPDPTWGNQSLGYGFNPHIRCTLKTLKMSMERGRICQDTTRRPANPRALSPVTGRQSSRQDLTLENSNFDEEDYDSSTNFGWCSPKCSGIKTQIKWSQNGTFSPPHTSPSQSPCWLPWRCEIPATCQTRVGQAMRFFHRETIPLNMVNLICLSKKLIV